MMIFSLVAMIGLEKCCITSACLQWLCHLGERTVARGPLVSFSLGDDTKWPRRVDMLLNLNTVNQNLKLLTIANSFLQNLAEHENFSANKYENTNVVGIFILISRENFMLS